MPIDPKAPGWDARQAALVAEFSEAHTYAALARAAQGDLQSPPVKTLPLAGGIALRCPADHSTTLFNRVMGLGLAKPFDDETADAVQSQFGHHDGPWGLELAPVAAERTPRELLRRLGLRRSLPTAMLAMDCSDPLGPRPPWRVERAGPDGSAQFAEVVARVFGVAALVVRILRLASTSPQFGQWVVFDGERAVATCMTHIHGQTAWFGWCATTPEQRGRGLQTALLWHSVRHAAEQGCRWITAETATGTAEAPDASYRNMRRFGFVELYRRHGYLCVPPPRQARR